MGGLRCGVPWCVVLFLCCVSPCLSVSICVSLSTLFSCAVMRCAVLCCAEPVPVLVRLLVLCITVTFKSKQSGTKRSHGVSRQEDCEDRKEMQKELKIVRCVHF